MKELKQTQTHSFVVLTGPSFNVCGDVIFNVVLLSVGISAIVSQLEPQKKEYITHFALYCYYCYVHFFTGV